MLQENPELGLMVKKDNYDRVNINIEFFKGLGKKKFDFNN